MKAIDISIIIPAYNEESRIGAAIKTISSYLTRKKFKYEIIVVDDGSRDSTAKIVKKAALRDKKIMLIKNTKNTGKGYSVKRGMLRSSGDVSLFTDADLSTPITEIKNMINVLREGFDVVIGSRRMIGSKVKVFQPPIRRLSGWVFHKTRKMIFLKDINDTQCGFKMFKKKAVKPIFSRQATNGFVFDVEILLIAENLAYKVKEIPVKWIDEIESSLKIRKHIKGIIKDCIMIRINQIKGLYK